VDISYAFTNSDIDAEIYMDQPEGFRQGGKEFVCRLEDLSLPQVIHMDSMDSTDIPWIP
jgi:hypothetical protein